MPSIYGLPFTINKNPSHVVASIYHTYGSVMGMASHDPFVVVRRQSVFSMELSMGCYGDTSIIRKIAGLQWKIRQMDDFGLALFILFMEPLSMESCPVIWWLEYLLLLYQHPVVIQPFNRNSSIYR